MKKNTLLLVSLVLCIILLGCNESEAHQDTRPPDIEPTATYDWMAGESPVPTKRMGVWRYGVNVLAHAVSAEGTYILDQSAQDGSTHYILYADHGSNSFIKLCSRADCAHNTSDCNAYLSKGMCLSYTDGYLYAVSGQNDRSGSTLIRMEPDGSDHVAVMDLLSFAKDHGGDIVSRAIINDGVLIFDVWYYEKTEDPSMEGMETLTSRQLAAYYYKLDGSMKEPKQLQSGWINYSCGDVFVCIGQAQHNDEDRGYWSWDPDTDTITYLTDHPGVPGYFDEDEGYFFRDGCIWRKTYADNQETVMLDTGLEGDYLLCSFPDCLMVASREFGNEADPNLYFYNWDFELIDTVAINYSYTGAPELLLIAETAERFILTDEYEGLPKYYINKSELGTGNVEIHEFNVA